MSHRSVTVSESQPLPYGQNIVIGPHGLGADEPREQGGHDSGPNPYELLMSALGACTNMTLRMYAAQKGWTLRSVTTIVSHEKVPGEDNLKIDVFTRVIKLEGNLDDSQKQRLLEIADRCPVSRTLEGQARMVPAKAE
jgi:putative redox protein